MIERDAIELLAETRDWLREVQIGDAVPAIDAGIAEIARLRAEVARLRLTDAEREAIKSAMDIAEAVGRPELRGALRALLARLGGAS